jgi:hypothetical protein
MATRRVLRRIADVLTWLERVIATHTYSFGLACRDGLVAYGMALHGLPPYWIQEGSSEESAEESITPQDQPAGARSKMKTPIFLRPEIPCDRDAGLRSKR